MWIVEAACAVAKQLELCSTSFPVSAMPRLPWVVFSQLGTRGHELHALCFWFRLRSHQLALQQKGWQPVRIPRASLLHPVSVCWTKWWHEALADATLQVAAYFFSLVRKQISWPWFHSRETCLSLTTAEWLCSNYCLFVLSSYISHCISAIRQVLAVVLKQQALFCVFVNLHHLHMKDNARRKLRVTVKHFLPL